MLTPAGLFLVVTIVIGGRPPLDSGSPVSFWTYPVWYDNRESDPRSFDASRGVPERNLGSSRGVTPPPRLPQSSWPHSDNRQPFPDSRQPHLQAQRPQSAGPQGQNWQQSGNNPQSWPQSGNNPKNWPQAGNNPQIWPQPRPHSDFPNRHTRPQYDRPPAARPETGRNQPQSGQIPPQSGQIRPQPGQNRPRPPRSAEDDRDVENYKSDLETPRDVPTRPDYKGKGHWAKGRLPNDKVVDVGFVPQKVYTQVRRYDTVRHLPRSAAAAEASTREELINAPRLREVLSHKKIQQVYEEEGYEDSGYDHGGYNHHGSKYADKEQKEDLSDKKRKHDVDSGSSEHKEISTNSSAKTRTKPVGVRWKRFHTESQTKKMSWDEDDATKSVVEEIEEVTEPFSRERESVTEKSGLNQTRNSDKVSGESSVESTTVKTSAEKESSGEAVNAGNENASLIAESREGSDDVDLIEPAESHSSHSAIMEEPSGRSLEARVVNDPRPKGSGVVTFPGRHTRRQYAMGRPVDVYVQESVGYGVRRPVYGVPVATNVHHYVPYMPAFPSYYTDNPGAYTAPVVSQRLPVKPDVSATAPIPTHQTPPPTPSIPPSDTGPVKFLNAADTLNAYANLLQQTASTNQPIPMDGQNYEDLIEPRHNATMDVHHSATAHTENVRNSTSRRRRPSRFRHPVSNNRGKQYNNFTRTHSSYHDSRPSGKELELKNPSPHTRHPSLPRDSSEDLSDLSGASAHAAALTSNHQPHTRSQDPVKYIESLTVAHYANAANVPSSPPSVQNERLKELARQLNARSEDLSGKHSSRISRRLKRSTEIEYDHDKYPFYDALKGLKKDSALRYASNPDDLPKKTPGGMEFYDTKDKLVKCSEPQPPEDITPERSEEGEWTRKPQPKNLPRIKGIGDSIDCLKRRYFGDDPLDNPFFKEDGIGDPPMYEMARSIKDDIKRHRNTRSTSSHNKRLMVIPPRYDNSSHLIYNNYTDADILRAHQTANDHHQRANGHSSFPYKNHKPENAHVSASVHNLRATSPYKYYSEYDESYSPTYQPQEQSHDSDSEDSKRHKYYHHGHKYKYVSKKKKKRTKPKVTHHYYRPLPVSIYSIIAASNNQPAYRKPMYSAGTSAVNRVIPIYHIDATKPSDSYVSDSNNSPTTPTRWYIVRPGEYTENKEIAVDSKPSSSSIWNYINPLRWWFPAYFDERRGEPKHRRRRSSEQELFNKILARTNNATIESRVFESFRTTPRNIEATTGQPISINEFKARLNTTHNRNSKSQSKVNRLSGGFLSSNIYATPAPPLLNTINTPSYVGNGQVLTGTTPIPMVESEVKDATTPKPKVLFPKTKQPRRRPQLTKKSSSPVSKGALTTTTTTTTTSTTPVTTTRMYKPKRIISKKKFDGRLPVDAFTVLKRAKQKGPTPSPFDSMESAAESGSIEEPRRMQQVEHRRVTKEEVYKTSYIPEEEARMNRHGDSSSEASYYSESSSEGAPMETTTEPDNHTLTYMVNPVTGVGSWGEQPRRTTWKPKRKYPKRHLNEDLGYTSSYTYPPIPAHHEAGGSQISVDRRSRKNKKRHSNDSPYDSQAYITGLMNQVYPTQRGQTPQTVRTDSAAEQAADLSRRFSSRSDEIKSYEESTGPGSDEISTTPPTKSPPKFILDPGKRKYFYVKAR